MGRKKGVPAGTRKFGGKRYIRTFTYSDAYARNARAKAEKKAAQRRKKGYGARVVAHKRGWVDEKGKRRTNYSVYERMRKK